MTVLEERDLIVYILEQRHKSHYWLCMIIIDTRRDDGISVFHSLD